MRSLTHSHPGAHPLTLYSQHVHMQSHKAGLAHHECSHGFWPSSEAAGGRYPVRAGIRGHGPYQTQTAPPLPFSTKGSSCTGIFADNWGTSQSSTHYRLAPRFIMRNGSVRGLFRTYAQSAVISTGGWRPIGGIWAPNPPLHVDTETSIGQIIVYCALRPAVNGTVGPAWATRRLDCLLAAWVQPRPLRSVTPTRTWPVLALAWRRTATQTHHFSLGKSCGSSGRRTCDPRTGHP
jgi:hypothetical protein